MTKKERWADQKAALLQLFSDENYTPMTEDELKELLLVEDDTELANALSSLVADKKVKKNNDGSYEAAPEQEKEVPEVSEEPDRTTRSTADKYLTGVFSSNTKGDRKSVM